MKVDKKVSKRLAKELEFQKRRIEKTYDKFISIAKKATEVEEIMRAKQTLLLSVVEELPLNTDSCYFCLIYFDEECKGCPYKKVHKTCPTERSDYNKIIAKRVNLEDAIENYYYGYDEAYEEVKNEKVSKI